MSDPYGRFSLPTNKEIVMGLDMYLEARRYVPAKDYRVVDGKMESFDTPQYQAISSAVDFGDKGKFASGGSNISMNIMYWRKANAVHKWFVDNVQDGKDDCQSYWVSREKLLELLDVCNRVKKDSSLAMELLPPQSGFFFGSDEVDDWYMDDLGNTIKGIEYILDKFSGVQDWSFYYQSSW